MRIDYDKRDWRFVSRILHENSRRLSRTRRGVSDTSASEKKRPLRLTGEALRAKAQENEEAAHRCIFESRHDSPPESASAVQRMLFSVADLANDGLLPEGRLRTWPRPRSQRAADTTAPGTLLSTEIDPGQLDDALREFSQIVHQRWGELASDPVPLASWAEWQLNAGPLHPFYDGCGRISRLFAALLFVRAGWLPPLVEDIEAYFRHANQGPTAFCDYVRERIGECAEWLEESQ